MGIQTDTLVRGIHVKTRQPAILLLAIHPKELRQGLDHISINKWS
jgi:hypothetical protein